MAFFNASGPSAGPTAAGAALTQAVAGNQARQRQLDALNAQAAAGLGGGMGNLTSAIGTSIWGPNSIFNIGSQSGQTLQLTKGMFEQGKQRLMEGGMPEETAHQTMVAQYRKSAADLLKTYQDTKLAKAQTLESKERGKVFGAQAQELTETLEGKKRLQKAEAEAMEMTNSFVTQVMNGRVTAENARNELARGLADREMSPKAQEAALAKFDADIAKSREVVETSAARIKAANAQALAATSQAEVSKALDDRRKEEIDMLFDIELDTKDLPNKLLQAQIEQVLDAKKFTERELEMADRKLSALIMDMKARHDLGAQEALIRARSSVVGGFSQVLAPLIKLVQEAENRGEPLPEVYNTMIKEITSQYQKDLAQALNDLMRTTMLDNPFAPGTPTRMVVGGNEAGYDAVDKRLGR